MQSSPGDDMVGGEAYNPPEWGGSQHCFVHLEPVGVSAPNLVVALEHELVHVQRRPGASGVDRADLWAGDPERGQGAVEPRFRYGSPHAHCEIGLRYLPPQGPEYLPKQLEEWNVAGRFVGLRGVGPVLQFVIGSGEFKDQNLLQPVVEGYPVWPLLEELSDAVAAWDVRRWR